mmetsp:Transcript_61044/g.74826  ORF Transcript_61044/g.74826 Transcript_61044/m.74826 type:complete len:121 (-) Transcript_61044:137-499(-)
MSLTRLRIINKFLTNESKIMIYSYKNYSTKMTKKRDRKPMKKSNINYENRLNDPKLQVYRVWKQVIDIYQKRFIQMFKYILIGISGVIGIISIGQYIEYGNVLWMDPFIQFMEQFFGINN